MELDFAVITPLIRAVSMAVSTLQRRGVTLILVLGAQLAYFNLKWAGPVKPLHQVPPPLLQGIQALQVGPSAVPKSDHLLDSDFGCFSVQYLWLYW